jgi:hypothetical protein
MNTTTGQPTTTDIVPQGATAAMDNPFGDAAPVGETAVSQVEQTRAAQEVQAAMIVAKKFPRNEIESYNRIMKSCSRLSLAESAIYSYPRGGQTVKGPSIHLAKALAKAWGNLDFGIRELSKDADKKESTVESFCWDMETNVRETKIFTVPHTRYTRNGTKTLTDPRDIYETIANNGARRLRACILGVIPQDVVDRAVARCYQTLTSGGKDQPLSDRIREMVNYFKEKGIDEKLLEKRLGHSVDKIDEKELLDLRLIANSLKEGAAKREDFFDVGTADGGFAADLNAEFADAKTKQTKSKK